MRTTRRQAGRGGAAVWVLLPLAAGCAAPDPPLAPGREVAGELRPGARHHFEVEVVEGEFLRVVAEQEGVDLVMRFVGLGEVDGAAFDREAPLGVPEEAMGLAARTGRARLSIAAAESDRHTGSEAYRLRLVEQRVATAADRERVAAELAFCRAKGLEGTHALEAEAGHQAAAAAFLALGERPAAAEALLRQGRLARRRSDGGEAARRALAQVRALLADGSRPWLVGAAESELGKLERGAGRNELAADRFRRAREVWQRLNLADNEASAWNDLGLTWKGLGELEQARSAYLKALELSPLGSRSLRGRAVMLSNLGLIELALDRPEEAIVDLEAARRLYLEIGEPGRMAVVENGLGIARLELGDALLARGHFAASLRLRQPASRGEALTWMGLGRAEAATHRWAEAEHAYLRAWPVLSAKADAEHISLLNARGWLAFAKGDNEAAHELFESARELAARLGKREEEAAQLAALAELERRRGELEAARALLARAVELVEERRAGTRSLELRASFLADKQGYYGELVEVLMELETRQPGHGFAAKALSVAERGRARALLDALSEAGAELVAEAPAGLLAEERDLERSLRQLRQLQEMERLAGEDPGPTEERRQILRRRLDHLRTKLRRELLPANRALAQPLDAAGIRALLDAETHLLIFRLGTRRSVVWHLSPAGLSHALLPGRAVIEQAARQTHTLLGSGYRREETERLKTALAGLSRLLLAPVAGRLTSPRLVIVPDGALAYLPFGALADPGTGTPLFERYEVVMLVSPSALALRRRELGRVESRRRGGWPLALTVVADPVYEMGDRRLERRGAARGAMPLTRLSFAADEARAVAEAAGGSSRVFTGFEARRDRILGDALAGSRVLHFATHGRLDSSNSEDSGLELSRFDADGEPIEGLLDLADIYRLKLDAELVTLSACQTALGREVRGEGLVGLTQGFLYAGASSLAVSLWRVDDEATAALMARFYHHLFTAGHSPGQALRRAQREIAAEPRWRSPYYWASFVLQGEWKSLPATGR